MINSIFFKIISSWEVIAAIVAFIIILPVTFYIASHDKNTTLEFVGIRKKRKKSVKNEEKKDNKEENTEKRRNKQSQAQKSDEENDEEESEENDKRRYEMLKRLKASKTKK